MTCRDGLTLPVYLQVRIFFCLSWRWATPLSILDEPQGCFGFLPYLASPVQRENYILVLYKRQYLSPLWPPASESLASLHTLQWIQKRQTRQPLHSFPVEPGSFTTGVLQMQKMVCAYTNFNSPIKNFSTICTWQLFSLWKTLAESSTQGWNSFSLALHSFFSCQVSPDSCEIVEHQTLEVNSVEFNGSGPGFNSVSASHTIQRPAAPRP